MAGFTNNYLILQRALRHINGDGAPWVFRKPTKPWQLAEPLRYVTNGGRNIIIPAGFSTDLASIPRCFRWVVPDDAEAGAAAVVHDYLYRTGACTRAEADAIFLEAMYLTGVPMVRRFVIWAAVRLFGWVGYRHR